MGGRALLAYLGVIGDSTCRSCDRCRDLPRPWASSELTHESLAASLPAKRICALLIRDTRGSRFSRRSLVRALEGDDGSSGPYPLSQRLIDHPAFGRLGLLSLEQIDSTIDDMLGRGEVTEVEEALDEAKSYFSLALTEVGLDLCR